MERGPGAYAGTLELLYCARNLACYFTAFMWGMWV